MFRVLGMSVNKLGSRGKEGLDQVKGFDFFINAMESYYSVFSRGVI